MLAVGLSLAGCGRTTPHASARAAHGKEVFAGACAGCHTLTGHDTSVPGGDLAMQTLSVADIESFVHVMPVQLTTANAVDVAAYVHLVETRLRHG